ncbi:MAG: hypothetical protein KDI64_21105, partial [Candidatus Accumulibacter sp.]|nr:hypothetical protein [Accumulibacter sp.]
AAGFETGFSVGVAAIFMGSFRKNRWIVQACDGQPTYYSHHPPVARMAAHFVGTVAQSGVVRVAGGAFGGGNMTEVQSAFRVWLEEERV